MKNIYEAALDDMTSGKKGLIAVIVSGTGSTPRGLGAKMYINEDGEFTDTIGGGPSEYNVVKSASDVIKAGKTVLKEFDMSGIPGRSASVCGGETKVLMHPVTPDDKPVLEAVANASKNGVRSNLYIWFEADKSTLVYIDDDFAACGNVEDEASVISACRRSAAHDDERIIYTEKLGTENKLFLLGAGHVAYYTAIVSNISGFKTIVIDDREEFANKERFPGCEIMISQTYNELPVDMISENDYVVTVTRGHVSDEEALEWALSSKAAYIGMIGSKSKCKTIFDNLLQKGFKQERLDFVHAPIGLNIGGRTPGEIAVSIMAEIIQIRSSLKGRL